MIHIAKLVHVRGSACPLAQMPANTFVKVHLYMDTRTYALHMRMPGTSEYGCNVNISVYMWAFTCTWMYAYCRDVWMCESLWFCACVNVCVCILITHPVFWEGSPWLRGRLWTKSLGKGWGKAFQKERLRDTPETWSPDMPFPFLGTVSPSDSKG